MLLYNKPPQSKSFSTRLSCYWKLQLREQEFQQGSYMVSHRPQIEVGAELETL